MTPMPLAQLDMIALCWLIQIIATIIIVRSQRERVAVMACAFGFFAIFALAQWWYSTIPAFAYWSNQSTIWGLP